MCDFLLLLNGYARTDGTDSVCKGGADSADHVEHFLLNCGDDDLTDLIYPQRVEKIISHRQFWERNGRNSVNV